MENPKEGEYKVIITDSAEISFYQTLDYLYDNKNPYEKRLTQIGENIYPDVMAINTG